MTLNRVTGRVYLVAAFLILFIPTGCCEKEQKRALELEQQVMKREAEKASLRASIAGLQFSEADAKACQTDLDGVKAELSKLGKQESLIEKRNATVRGLLDKLKQVIESGDLAVRVRRGRMVLELPSAVLFQSGSAELSEKGKETLDSVTAVLKEIKDRKFQVAGHTDNVPIGNDNPFENNWHLSTARAVQVVMYMDEKGMNPRSLSAAGYSQFQPVRPNKSKKGKARNRRIEITLMPNLAELPDLSALEKNLGLGEEG